MLYCYCYSLCNRTVYLDKLRKLFQKFKVAETDNHDEK